MNKKFIKLCLASILSLSLHTNLQAQELPQTTFTQEEEEDITEDISSKAKRFIQEIHPYYPSAQINFFAQKEFVLALEKFFVKNNEIAFSGYSHNQNIDLFCESLGDREWIGSLRSFNLDCVKFDPNASALSSIFDKMPNLQSLILNDTNLRLMEEAKFNAVANALSHLTKLQILDLNTNNLGTMDENGIRTLANALSHLTNLQILNLNHNSIGGRLAILAPAIANMTDLQRLSLCDNNLGTMDEDDIDTFASALSKLTKLQTLDLSHNGLGRKLAILAPAIANLIDLQTLYLSHNKLGAMDENGLHALASALSLLTKLETLNLSNNNLGEGSAILASAFVNLTNLQNLFWVYDNLGTMDEKGLHALASALSHLTKLQVLTLSYNSIGGKLAVLAPAIANMTDLQSLALSANQLEQIQPEVWQTFTTSLSYTTNLQYLFLFRDHIEDSTLNVFIEAILQTESIAGIPNLTLYSDSPRLKTTHDLIISFPFQDEAVHARIQDELSAFNPAIKLIFE